MTKIGHLHVHRQGIGIAHRSPNGLLYHLLAHHIAHVLRQQAKDIGLATGDEDTRSPGAQLIIGNAWHQISSKAVPLHPKIKTTEKVTVVGHRPMFRMKNGNLITRVRNTPLSKEPMLEDVLKHIPGMRRNAEGSFEVSGLGQPTIYLNDKKATSAELSHLDVKQIEEIELITTPGAEYDAATGAVLKNIMRRRDEGIFGKLQAYDKIREVNTTNEDITLGWVVGCPVLCSKNVV